MARPELDQPFYDYAWEQLVTSLLQARRQAFRSLAVLAPRGSHARACLSDLRLFASLETQPLWQATWSRPSPRVLPDLMEQDLPELFMDLPAEASTLIERWHARWEATGNPSFVHIFPKVMDVANGGDRFLPHLGLVTAFVSNDVYGYIVTSGMQHHGPLNGSPILVVFATLILIRPLPGPYSFIRRVL